MGSEMISDFVMEEGSLVGFKGWISSSLNRSGALIRNGSATIKAIEYDSLNISLDAREAT